MSRNDTVWTEDHDIVIGMFAEAGVAFRWYTGPIRMGLTGMWSGKQYSFLGGNAIELTDDAECLWTMHSFEHPENYEEYAA